MFVFLKKRRWEKNHFWTNIQQECNKEPCHCEGLKGISGIIGSTGVPGYEGAPGDTGYDGEFFLAPRWYYKLKYFQINDDLVE